MASRDDVVALLNAQVESACNEVTAWQRCLDQWDDAGSTHHPQGRMTTDIHELTDREVRDIEKATGEPMKPSWTVTRLSGEGGGTDVLGQERQ